MLQSGQDLIDLELGLIWDKEGGGRLIGAIGTREGFACPSDSSRHPDGVAMPGTFEPDKLPSNG